MNKTLDYIDELLEFLKADLWTKFRPFERVNGKMFKRKNAFESEKDMLEYLNNHFDLLKEQIKEQNK